MTPEHKLVFVNTATHRVFAEYRPDRPDEEDKFWYDPAVSLGEINGLIKWMGKIQEYVMNRKFIPIITIPVDVEPVEGWQERCHAIKRNLE